ncbi:hypothetical protein ACEE23_01360 [Corynebacterium sp. 32222D000AT]
MSDGELVPTSPAAAIRHYRGRNEFNPRELLAFTTTASFGVGFFFLDHTAFYVLGALCLVAAVACGVKIARHYPKAVGVPQMEIRDGDYPAAAYFAPFIPIVAPLLALPLKALGWDFSVPPAVAPLSTAAFYSVGLFLSGTVLFRRSYSIGRRRIQRMDFELTELTATTQRLAEENTDILAALIAIGAVDGNEVSLKGLQRILAPAVSADEEALRGRLQELDSTKLVKLRAPTWQGESAQWWMSITAVGVHALTESQRR